jgi:hypothetical protein|tara:strand:+ start:1163 stop:1669 length:507 start_codon:yes stop_codon:yes gene_type:complete
MINYCSLEEAWGADTSKGNQVYLDHKKKFKTDNPINTPNINYECSLSQEPETHKKETLTGYQGKSLVNYHSNEKIVNQDPLYNKMNNENKDLHNFIMTLNIDEATKRILINKISGAIDSIKYEHRPNIDIREDFQNNYYRPNHSENRNIDILFLILLGLFIIFILDKK